MAAAETAKMIAELVFKDSMSKGVSSAIGNVNKLDKGFGRAGKGAGKLGKGLAIAGAAIATGVGAALAGAAKATIDYQDAFQGVVKTVDEADLTKAGSSFQKLSDDIRAMSREMPNSAIELAGIAESAGALGIKAKDIEAFTKQVAILAATTNVSADDAATALGQLQNVIGLTGDEFDNFAAALVDLGNKGASTEADILEIARRSGGAAKLFGIAKDKTLGWAAAAANLGLNSELAGTSLQNVFLKLMPKVSEGSKDLAKLMGQSAASVKKSFAKDASGSLERLLKKLGSMPKDARLAAVQRMFGKGSGITRLVLGLAESVDKNLKPALDTSTQAWKDATAAQVEFDKRNSTIKSAFSRLKNNILDAAVTLGEGFAPALGRAADKLSKFLSLDGNRAKLKSLGEDIGKAIDSIDFDKLLRTAEGVVSALKPAAAILLKIGEMIGKLPPELLGAGGALVITNKVTGGLILKGAGDVFGGLAEKLAVGLATHIPLFGSAFVQPVFVTNQGFGTGGKNPVDTVLDTAGKVGIIEAIRQSIGRLLKPGGLMGGGGAAINGFDIEGFRKKVEGADGPLERLRKKADSAAGALDGLTGHGGPGRGNVPTPGLTGHGGPGRGGPRDEVAKRIADLHHGAVQAIDATGKTTADATDRAGRDTKAATDRAATAVVVGSQGVMQNVRGGATSIVGAIHSLPVPIVNVDVNVTGAQVTKSQTVVSRSSTTASRNDDRHNP